ncbi:MAG TPA: Hsp20/alpha crystallin family protein [Streptosporangiaceae bacterium]|nr:Hsp20/alpha crystallin family protein [Streptosporangiaceae bacterium]
MLLTSFDPIASDFDRLVQRTFGRADGITAGRVALPMDVIRRDSDVVLRIDLPGADPDSIEVTTDRRILTVSAKRDETFGEQDKPVVRERVMGTFTRKIRLTETVDTEKVEAQYENGVLTVVLPIAEQAKPHKIEIKRPGAPELTA